MMKKFFTLLFSVLTLYLANAYAGKSMGVTASCSEGAFVITLPANPTTGYQWAVPQFDSTKFKLKSQRYVAPKTRLMGAGGVTLFNFQVLNAKSCPKSTLMVFTYARSWDPKSATHTTVNVKFIASKKSS